MGFPVSDPLVFKNLNKNPVFTKYALGDSLTVLELYEEENGAFLLTEKGGVES